MPTSSTLDKPSGQIVGGREIISQKQLDATHEHRQKRKGKHLGQNLFLYA